MALKPLPTTEELDQTRSMLADKPQDWKPDQPTDFGAMFAQPLVVTCVCNDFLFLLVCMFFCWPCALPLAQAQTTTAEPEKKTIVIDKRKLLVQPRNADGTIMETAFMEDPVLWMRTKQQNFYGRMSQCHSPVENIININRGLDIAVHQFSLWRVSCGRAGPRQGRGHRLGAGH